MYVLVVQKNIKPNGVITCLETILSNPTVYHTKAIWDIVHGGASIWSSIE